VPPPGLVGVAQAAELVPAVVEQERDGRDEFDAGSLLQRLVKVEVFPVDLVGVVGLDAEPAVDEPLVVHPRYLVQRVLYAALVYVRVMKPACPRVEVPDTGAVPRFKGCPLEVAQRLLPVPDNFLRTDVLQKSTDLSVSPGFKWLTMTF